MPFKKVGSNDYTSPSGRHFNSAQVRLYYANGGKFPGEKGYSEGGAVANKGYLGKTTSYAEGGAVLGRTRNFLKEQDEFRDPDEGDPNADADQKYAKSGEGAGRGMVPPPAATGKSLKPVKPRS